jgi:hypothetical protein
MSTRKRRFAPGTIVALASAGRRVEASATRADGRKHVGEEAALRARLDRDASERRARPRRDEASATRAVGRKHVDEEAALSCPARSWR